MSLSPANVTTAFEMPGYRIVRNLGVVRGINVRPHSDAFGGNWVTLFTKLCERGRSGAFDLMVQEAEGLGANAIVGMRYETNDATQGITEFLAYGTAVIVEPLA